MASSFIVPSFLPSSPPPPPARARAHLRFVLRYFHHLLFYSMFMRLDGAYAIFPSRGTSCDNDDDTPGGGKTYASPATIAFKLLVTWLYLDAGYGKYADPLRGWTWYASPLPALDTYVRHTRAARYAYAFLGPAGLRLATPSVVYVELLGAPCALFASYLAGRGVGAGRIWLYRAICLMCSMHVGIALTMNNTVILSSIACVAWCIFLPEGVGDDIRSLFSSSSWSSSSSSSTTRDIQARGTTGDPPEGVVGVGPSFVIGGRHGISTLAILAFVSGSIWFETMSEQCDQSMEHIWSTLLHNRWNVFVGAEE